MYLIRNLGEISPEIYSYYNKMGLMARHFLMPADTDAFCRLAELSVNEGDVVLDLGCGDGFASIHALKCGARHVYGVDVSEDALKSAHSNMNLYRKNKMSRDSKLDLSISDMLDVIQSPISYHIDMIISNPPYIPVGDLSSVDTVNGGRDGLKFIRPLIDNQISARLSWLQGSVSSPFTTIEMIKANGWNIKKILAYAVKFRSYARQQYPYLDAMRKQKLAYFYSDIHKRVHWFLKLGFVCEKNDFDDKKTKAFESELRRLLEAFSEYGPYLCLEASRLEEMHIHLEYGIYSQ